MILNSLTAISPVDGRYRDKVDKLSSYFSEFALIRYRVTVEIEYFISLCEIPLPQLEGFPAGMFGCMRNIAGNFSLEDAQRIKEIEKTTNHDVKAVEYFLKEKFDILSLGDYKEFIHFGLTSQDINNTALPMAIRDAMEKELVPALGSLVNLLQELADEWKDITILARTHGQPASPTKLGKELLVFVERIQVQLTLLARTELYAKFGGATGNFNAHHAAYPGIDWNGFANSFVQEKLNLNRSQYTTQIAHYDDHGAVFDGIKRINTILLDLDRDMWTYISMNYFRQKIKKGEVGSSTMPHKVNPIDFENSEGNLGLANALLEHLARKLPLSRLQRDLTDSTVIRNMGVAFGYCLTAYQSTLKGLGKIRLNPARLAADLDTAWEVMAEPIQTVMRKHGLPNPYERLKDLTRGRTISADDVKVFIEGLEIPAADKARLLALTPATYIGLAPTLAKSVGVSENPPRLVRAKRAKIAPRP